MAKTELDRLLALGLITPAALKRIRRGSKDPGDRDTRDHFSYSGRGDDESDATAVGLVSRDHVDAREYQRAKKGFVPDVKGQQSSNLGTGADHLDKRPEPPGNSWEKPRQPAARWREKIPSVARAKKSSADEYWNVDWYGGPDSTRME